MKYLSTLQNRGKWNIKEPNSGEMLATRVQPVHSVILLKSSEPSGQINDSVIPLVFNRINLLWP